MEPHLNPLSRPLVPTASATSIPLTEVEHYRPGPHFALLILLVPVAAALVGTAISLYADGSVPVWLPFLVFLWLPLLPVVWFVLQNVRTSPYGIAAGRPWRTWEEIPWLLIEHVEQTGPIVRISGSNGQQLTLLPFLLRDGRRLKRQLWLRLPGHIFAGGLALEGDAVLANGIHSMPEGGLSGTLRGRPQTRWRLAVVGLTFIMVGLTVVCLTRLPLGVGIPVALVCALIAVVSLLMSGWMAQRVTVSNKGISVSWTFTRRTREMPWEQVQFIEHSSGQALLRFRGDTRIVCAGPALFSSAQRDLLRAFLHEYCASRGVPIVRRTQLLWPAS